MSTFALIAKKVIWRYNEYGTEIGLIRKCFTFHSWRVPAQWWWLVERVGYVSAWEEIKQLYIKNGGSFASYAKEVVVQNT